MQSVARFLVFAGRTVVSSPPSRPEVGSTLTLVLLITTVLAVILIVRTFKAPAAPDPLSVTRRWH